MEFATIDLVSCGTLGDDADLNGDRAWAHDCPPEALVDNAGTAANGDRTQMVDITLKDDADSNGERTWAYDRPSEILVDNAGTTANGDRTQMVDITLKDNADVSGDRARLVP